MKIERVRSDKFLNFLEIKRLELKKNVFFIKKWRFEDIASLKPF